MQIAPPTKDEIERLQALYDYDVLDTEAEKVFDDLTQLASEICNTPIALISLVDPERQWFKSKVGLDAKETPRDIAFCAHAIHQRAIFEVEDTLLDSRFADNPLVIEEPKIRFYAGTPLVTPEGFAIGTLCAIDSKPHKLTPTQANALEILGRNVISQLELRKKIKQLQEADQHKTTFLSTMSHELRTPLNAIISFSTLLLNDVDKHAVPEKFKRFIQHIDYSGKRLLAVVNSILDFNKIEAGKMTFEPTPINLGHLVTELYGMLAVGALEKNITFETDLDESLPPILLLDEAKFCQIVINLVSNSIKFTPANKKVKLIFQNQNNQLCIIVIDQGVGISQTDQSKLFSAYQQVGKSKNTQGSGLGLLITKGLVELMQGKITLESEVNQGSCFKVELPILLPLNSGETKQQTQLNQRPFLSSSRILVVEDNEINQQVIESLLDSFNLTATFADSGEEALETTVNQQFDLILMDIHLPGMDGIETTQLLKKKQIECPIVALSADTFQRENMSDKQSLFHEYLTKPIEIDKLLNVLNRFLPSA